MKDSIIWAEMARRKIKFHNNKVWNKVRLWGLFQWSDVSWLLKLGKLKTHMEKENRIIWVFPSKEAWQNEIKPLIDKYSLEKLTELAGW